MAINQTFKELLMGILEEAGRPLQKKEILDAYRKKPYTKTLTPTTLGVLLCNGKKENLLVILKHPGIPSFYCNPNWVNEEGELKEEYQFDWRTKKIKVNATKA